MFNPRFRAVATEYALVKTDVCQGVKLEDDFGGQYYLPGDTTVACQSAGFGISRELWRAAEEIASLRQTRNHLQVGVINEIVKFGTKLQTGVFVQSNIPG